MSAAVAPDDAAADESGKATIEYSFIMRVEGLSQPEIDHFVAGIDGWRIKPGSDEVFLYPQGEPDFDGNAGEYLHDVFSRHEKLFEEAARTGTSRKIDLAIYFDANRIAAICPTFDAVVIRRLADLNFSLVVSVFPSSFEDDEGTEE
ncbi:MAG TPA: hypothetical protein VGN93_18165 [Shinella sp.]|uniref:hypothetical protein n=1 Tax=Shinella sp. TaxID=1870904 RepID=UPI002E13C8D9|nr:hypothetical protein [Shinella sp.]